MPHPCLAIVLALALAASGCVRCEVGRATTTGQERADLDKALAAGALTAAEHAAITSRLTEDGRP